MSTLLVIAKAPRPGRSKTRLCPPCTPAQAAALARAALLDTLDAVRAARRPTRRVLVLDGPPGPWLPRGFEVIEQRGCGLAERLEAAFADAKDGGLLIGMDTPQITPALLDEALEHPCALGMADDGGWWGISLPGPDRRVFEAVPMSSPFTGAWQLARLRALGLSPAVLPRLRDVDTIRDAHVVAAQAPASRFAAELLSLQVAA